jgi:hypothetical protein
MDQIVPSLLAMGVKAAGIKVHQLDWDHLLRPLWGQVARLEKAADTALPPQVEERVALFVRTQPEKRLQQHLNRWEHLTQMAAKKVDQFDAFYQMGAFQTSRQPN